MSPKFLIVVSFGFVAVIERYPPYLKNKPNGQKTSPAP